MIAAIADVLATVSPRNAFNYISQTKALATNHDSLVSGGYAFSCVLGTTTIPTAELARFWTADSEYPNVRMICRSR